MLLIYSITIHIYYSLDAKSGKLKFERTGGQPSVSLCETQLRKELNQLNTSGGDNNNNSGSSSAAIANKVTVTLIGIGKNRSIYCSIS